MKNKLRDSVVNKEKYDLLKQVFKEIECDKCHKMWKLSDTDVKKESIIVKGVNLTITYFLCPCCNKLYPVTIDTLETVTMQEELNNLINRVSALKLKGKSPTEQLIKKVNRQRALLAKKQKELKKIYNGTFYQKSQP